jgi:hypothetical protein
MDDKIKDEMIEYLMKMYRDKTEDWVFGVADEDVDLDDDRWSDFDSYSDEDEEDDLEDDFEGVSTILMDELTANNLDSHILLKYPRIADWWGNILTTRKKKEEKKRKAEEARRKKEEDARARESLLARLTPEERRLLGVK